MISFLQPKQSEGMCIIESHYFVKRVEFRMNNRENKTFNYKQLRARYHQVFLKDIKVFIVHLLNKGFICNKLILI